MNRLVQLVGALGGWTPTAVTCCSVGRSRDAPSIAHSGTTEQDTDPLRCRQHRARGKGVVAMKEHPTDKDLLKEGTKTKASPLAVAKTVITGLLTGLPRTAAGLVRRVRK